MTEDLTPIIARLLLHETLLESVCLNWMAQEPDALQKWDAISRGFVLALRSGNGELQPLKAQAVKLAETFCAKVREQLE